MSLTPPPCMIRGLAAASLIAAMLLVACATPAPPERPVAPSSELSFDAGVDYAIDDLLVQARRLPAFNIAPGILKKESDVPRGVIAVDPAIDGNTGQQTTASKALDSRLLQRAADKFAQFDVAPVSANTVGKAQFVLAGVSDETRPAVAGLAIRPTNCVLERTGRLARWCCRLHHHVPANLPDRHPNSLPVRAGRRTSGAAATGPGLCR